MDTLSLLDRGTSSTCLVLARLSQRSLGSVLARRLSVRPRLVQGRSSAWSSKTLPAGPARGGHRHVLPGRLHLLAPQGRDILGMILLPLIFISSLRALRIELGARAALVGLSGPVGSAVGVEMFISLVDLGVGQLSGLLVSAVVMTLVGFLETVAIPSSAHRRRLASQVRPASPRTTTPGSSSPSC